MTKEIKKTDHTIEGLIEEYTKRIFDWSCDDLENYEHDENRMLEVLRIILRQLLSRHEVTVTRGEIEGLQIQITNSMEYVWTTMVTSGLKTAIQDVIATFLKSKGVKIEGGKK